MRIAECRRVVPSFRPPFQASEAPTLAASVWISQTGESQGRHGQSNARATERCLQRPNLLTQTVGPLDSTATAGATRPPPSPKTLPRPPERGREEARERGT